jgi:hypothetical protein
MACRTDLKVRYFKGPMLRAPFQAEAIRFRDETFLAWLTGQRRRGSITLERMSDDQRHDTSDPRHAGRVNDKEMPIRQAGMEMSKPGLPDLRKRKHSVTLPEEDEAQTQS